MDTKGTLIFFCGKMGAGKTTQSLRLAQELNAVLLSEDDWLASLYPNEITDFNAYLHFSARLKPLIKAHVQNLLNTGVSAILDFPGNMSAAAPAVALSAMNEMMSQYITKEAAAIFDEIRIPVITVNGDL